MEYLNSIRTHLHKQESLYESLVRFSDQTLKDIEYARSLRSDYTNKLLDRIFGYETVTVVDEEGKKISKRIPKQRITSIAPPNEVGISDIKE